MPGEHEFLLKDRGFAADNPCEAGRPPYNARRSSSSTVSVRVPPRAASAFCEPRKHRLQGTPKVIDLARPVRVFRNWKRGCYSIRQGTYVLSASAVELGDVEFLVRESGRQRMLKTGRKNVHAYAVGRLVGFEPVTDEGTAPESAQDAAPSSVRSLSYDARIAGHFYDRETQTPVLGSSRAFFDQRGARYVPETPALPAAA